MVLFAAADEEDPLHKKAVYHLKRLRDNLISAFALIEFDVVLRSRGLSAKERSEKHALLLSSYPLAAERVTRPSPSTFFIAARLEEDHDLDYFDSLVAADALMHDGVIISTDVEMDRIPSLRRMW